eukprot:TRINITY_DN20015_c0_g1_i1.p1 TRINITY_DN20015_c0_g1~~TRINITY_DN20015_c0_g1_i1.p1  ORF type:complete len:517 (+),score=117.44 TRINITY_DN20015_c0_g1_i1:218-1768(+)
MTEHKKEAIRNKFLQCDASGNGRLAFAEFFALLQQGNAEFKKSRAEALFHIADQDLSGEVDFEEFLNFLYADVANQGLFNLEEFASEEDAKNALLSKPVELRQKAARARDPEVQKGSKSWKQMTWKERLSWYNELEKCMFEQTEGDVRSAKAPTKDPTSSKGARGHATQAKSSEKRTAATYKTCQRSEHEEKTSATVSPFAAAMHALPVKKTFAVSQMSQSALVNYSLDESDFDFVGDDKKGMMQLEAFKEDLCTAEGLGESIHVEKFLAKGTAGWVFLTSDAQTGSKLAMKAIRMTQARTGAKEWYVSKLLRTAGIADVVLTREEVRVLDRDQATPTVRQQLQAAGPVQYYVCMFQDLMPWGTLEDLARSGDLSPEIMFIVAKTLAAMHAAGIQHRDIKPEHIMLEMDHDEVVGAKLCDLGSASLGESSAARQDDVRRFGITLFSVATGEGWTHNRLIHEHSEALVGRLAAVVEDTQDAALKRLPDILKSILCDGMEMSAVASLIDEVGREYDSS